MGFRRFKRGYKSLAAPIDPAAAIAAAAKEHKDPTDPYFAYQWYLVSQDFSFSSICFLSLLIRDYIIGCKTQSSSPTHYVYILRKKKERNVNEDKEAKSRARSSETARKKEAKNKKKQKKLERSSPLMKFVLLLMSHANGRRGRKKNCEGFLRLSFVDATVAVVVIVVTE